MKNFKTTLFLSAMAALLVFSACKKESEPFEPVSEPPPADNGYFGESIIKSSVGGVIVDENGNGVSNASVRVGTNTMQTDANGVFIFKDIFVNEKRTFVQVTKNGFFYGSRALYPETNSVSYVKIQLLSASTIGSFSSSSGGTISTSGLNLNFPANSIKIEGGGI